MGNTNSEIVVKARLGKALCLLLTMARFDFVLRLSLLLVFASIHPCSSQLMPIMRSMLSWMFGSSNDPPDCFCVSPYEEDLCRVGAQAMCRSFICYGTDALCENQAVEKYLFFQTCYLFNNIVQRFNCKEDKSQPWYSPTLSLVSDRPNAQNCFADSGVVRLTTPPRGNCDPGSCCEANDQCPVERIMHFMSLGYGIDVDEGSPCQSSTDFYGDNADCTWLSDGISNDALVCRDAKVLVEDDGYIYCDVSLTATNDIYDLFRFVRNFVNVGDRREIIFEGVDESSTVQFTAIRALVDIGLGKESNEEDDSDGIVEIVYASLVEKGCLTRENAGVHLAGHSLGGFLANILALKVASQFPEVKIKINTAGEPAGLVVPLQGTAAQHPMWKEKVRYISGQVFPTGNTIDGIGLRKYGFYQVYDFVPQIIPAGLYFEGEGTTVQFLCETLQPNNRLSHFIAGREGCAASRYDVRNGVPELPMEGILQERSFTGSILNLLLTFFAPNLDSATRRSISVWLSVASDDLREDFTRVLDSHAMRRYTKMINIVTRDGQQCNGTIYTESAPLSTTCAVSA